MKTFAPRIAFLRRLLPAACVCALSLPGPRLPAAEYTFSTGDALPGLANNDILKLSGSSGNVTLSNGTVLGVNEWVVSGTNAEIAASGITIRQEDQVAGQWALWDASGAVNKRPLRFTNATAVTAKTVTLDRLIVANANMNATGGGLYVAGNTATNLLILAGDVIFKDNVSTATGGAVSTQNGSLTFAGAVVFDGNKAGYSVSTGTFDTVNARNGGAIYSGGANASSEFTFQQTALFTSNTAGRSGGAIYGNTGNTLLFMQSATFWKNASLGASGGAIFLNGGVLTFQGDAFFEGNSAGATGNGGGIYTANSTTLSFNGATTVFKNNRAGGAGGGMMAGDIDINSAMLSVTGNTAVSNGGGIRGATRMTLNGAFEFLDNQAGVDGGALAMGALEINNSGTFARNIAARNGGALATMSASADMRIAGAVSFLDNHAGGNGGAIYAGDGRSLTLAATSGDIVFEGNTSGATLTGTDTLATGGTMTVSAAGAANAVYFGGATGTLTLDAAAGRTIRFHDPVSATGTTVLTVTKTGAGTVVFREHVSDIVADTTVEAGVFRLDGGATYGAANNAGSFEVGTGATLSLNGLLRAGSIAFDNGAVLEVLGGGVFALDSAAPISYGTGLGLAGSGTLSTGVALNASLVRPGADGVTGAQILTLTDSVTLASGGIIAMDLFAGTGTDGYGLSDRVMLAGAGAITLAGGNRLDIQSVQSGIFNLGNIGSLYGNIQLTLNGEVLPEVGRQSASLSQSGGDLILHAVSDYSRVVTWTGTGGAPSWDIAGHNWTGSGGVTQFAAGDRVVFDAALPAAARSIELGTGGARVSDMLVSSAADYTFTGSGGITADPDFVVEIGGTTGVSAPGGKLVKTGAGMLTFANTGTNVFKGGIEIAGGAVAFDTTAQLGNGETPISFTGSGTLRANTNSLTLANAVDIADGVTAALYTAGQSGTGTMVIWDGAITGTAGTLVKTGPAGLILRGAVDVGVLEVGGGLLHLSVDGATHVRQAINIRENGVLRVPNAQPLTTGGASFTLTNAGELRIGKAGGLITGDPNPYRKVTLTGNYVGHDTGAIVLGIGPDQTGYLVLNDVLEVTGAVSGTVNIRFEQDAILRYDADWTNVAPLITTDPASVTADVVCAPLELDNGLLRTLVRNSDGTWGWTQSISPTLPLMLGVDAASILIGKASLASLSQRLMVTRTLDASRGLQLWVNGLQQDDEIKLNFYDGSKIDTQGVQVGADWSWNLGGGRLAVGAFYDYAKSDMHQHSVVSITSTSTEANGYGVYGTYKVGRWYVDLLGRGATEDYDINVPGNPTFSTKGDSWAGSIEVGRSFLDRGGYVNWEPQVQLVYQTHSIDDPTDYVGRVYDIDSADSLEGRAGLRLWLEHEWKPGCKIMPWLRVSYLYEFMGDTAIAVADRVYESDLGGSKGIVDLGVTLQVGRSLGVSAKGSYGFGERVKGFGFDLGVSLLW
ncbi:autotransporter outer membrane beta-barrel domain-containing protein [Termitidicoccus mucosus]